MDMDEFGKIINGPVPVLVDFFATWCGPCRVQGPILEQVKSALGDAVCILKVDIDRNQELAARFRVQSVPTLMVFVGGEVVWRESGVHQAADLEAKLREYVS